MSLKSVQLWILSLLVGLGSPLLHRNTRTQRNWSPETFYPKPAHPGGRSCCCSLKYTYTACPVLYSSHVWLCPCSCTSVLTSALQSPIRFYLSLWHRLSFPRICNPTHIFPDCLGPESICLIQKPKHIPHWNSRCCSYTVCPCLWWSQPSMSESLLLPCWQTFLQTHVFSDQLRLNRRNEMKKWPMKLCKSAIRVLMGPMQNWRTI